MDKQTLTKFLLETALETNGSIRSCPIEYNQETKKWFFWFETWAEKSKDFDSLDEVLEAFEMYCLEYLKLENKQ